MTEKDLKFKITADDGASSTFQKVIGSLKAVTNHMHKLAAVGKQVGNSFAQFFDPINTELRALNANQEKAIAKMGQFKSISSAISDSMSKRNNWAAPLHGMKRTIGENVKKLDQFDKIVQKTGKNIERLGKQVGFKGFKNSMKGAMNAMKSFRMEMLGIMFAGMAMQRFFIGIMKSAVGVFTKIMESSNISGTAVQQLAMHWEFLKFSVGSVLNSVLMPLMPMITRLIIGFSEWIQKNRKLVGWFLIIGAAIGTLLFVFGQIGLAVNSIVLLFTGPLGTAVGSALSAAAGVGLGAILMWVGIIIAIIAVLVAMWKTNFGGIQDYTKKTFEVIWKTIKNVFSEIWNILSNFFKFFQAIFKGNWEEAGTFLLKALLALIRGALKLVAGLGIAIVNAFIFAWNLIVDTFLKIVVNGLLYQIEQIGQGIVWLINLIPGVDIKLGDFTKGIRDSINVLADSLHGDFLGLDDLGAVTNLIDKIAYNPTNKEAVKEVVDVEINVEAKGQNIDEEAMANKVGDVVMEKLYNETKANIS